MCLLHIFCDNEEQKAPWRREYRLVERVLTAFNQAALSGPHSAVDVDKLFVSGLKEHGKYGNVS